MTIEEQIEVMTHFRDGGKVEYLINKNWAKVDYPIWDFSMIEYRKKPEKKTRLMTAEELKGKWLISDDSVVALVDRIAKKQNEVWFYIEDKNGASWYSVEEIANDGWMLEDGSPLMKEVGDE